MAEQSRELLKTHFQIGDRPTEEQFGHLIDSVINKPDDEISIAPNNNVGIGTNAPSEKLEVDGNIKADELIADQLIAERITSPVKTTWQEAQKIQASDAQADDNFGNSVAIDGDWIFVGANREDTGAAEAGSVYPYRLENGQWVGKPKLQASDAQADDYFGTSVAIDGEWALVGAPGEDTGGTNAGSAYMYRLEDGKWTEHQKIKASDVGMGDSFGISVAINGEWALVGAPVENSAGPFAGSAYLYHLENGQWEQRQKIQPDYIEIYDLFGYSLAIDGDWILISSYEEDTGAPNAGSAYLYHLENGEWSEQQTIQASDYGIGDRFGSSVAIDGDWVLVGAPSEDTGGTNAGSAYLYRLENGLWTEQQKLQASDAQAEDRFGISVAINGDLALVGAREKDIGGESDAGSVYLYQLENGQWVEKQKFRASDLKADDNFGASVAIDGDWILTGAPEKSVGGGSNAGGAYLYHPIPRVNIPGELEMEGAIKYSGPYTGTILYGHTSQEGIPTADGFRIRYDNNFFAANLDALIFEKTDSNHSNPDGGFAFLNTGADGIPDHALTIRGNSRIGIRTSAPNSILDVHTAEGNSAHGIVISQGDEGGNANSGRLFFENSGEVENSFSILKVDDRLSFRYNAQVGSTSGTEAMILTNTGRVGIGTFAPNTNFSVNGGASKPGGGVWGVFSDKRLKKEIKPFHDGLEMLKKIMPVWYRYNGKTGINDTNKNVGIIAQDIQEIFPYMVTSYKARLNKSDKKDTELLSFDGSALDYVMINAIKELDDRLAKLESQLAANSKK